MSEKTNYSSVGSRHIKGMWSGQMVTNGHDKRFITISIQRENAHEASFLQIYIHIRDTYLVNKQYYIVRLDPKCHVLENTSNG